jgi:hypothetical protein
VPRRVVIPHAREVYNFGSGLDRRKMIFKLTARINRSDAQTIRQALDQLAGKGSLKGKR